MKSHQFYSRFTLALLTVCAALLVATSTPTHAFTDQVIQQGATGDDVVELQSRLQYIGFYNGKIDGVYGWGTYWAVRNYQYEFGLDIDGLVGPEMKEMLAKSTEYNEQFVKRALNEGRKFTHYGGTPKKIQKGPKGSRDKQMRKGRGGEAPAPGGGQTGEAPAPAPGGGQTGETPAPGGGQTGETPAPAPGEAAPGGEAPAPETPEQAPVPEEETPEDQNNDADIEKATNVPPGYSDNDLQLMAQAVYGEARGEPYVGQVAVAAVIINRINSPTFPNTVSGVIFEPRAFTAVADGQIWMTPDDTARRAVLDALNGQDPSGNAMYYFNPDTATSGWIWSRPQIKKIGKHIFCH
ncbi:cell wall hydrolase [Alkalihalophilus pseudofirmus]|uniref:Spore cortex-lytic enzyme n=1 Tax=Alkalihalophilus pseudofirmus TaxID=79885 RepID=A0AAJ2KTB4_ALKPS|nr:cell wall hydrolase [Alkalihalophilus pseudofirmus]MDV2884304.1 cell wall hydrolase [Alkalihalophilus pseudofirmus]